MGVASSRAPCHFQRRIGPSRISLSRQAFCEKVEMRSKSGMSRLTRRKEEIGPAAICIGCLVTIIGGGSVFLP